MSSPETQIIDTPIQQLTIALLGDMQIALNGAPLTFDYKKVQALLIYLAIESGREHRRGVLAGLLWPDRDELAARHSLSQALLSLRRTVRDAPDAPLLLATRDTLRINPRYDIGLDVADFQQLCGPGADIGRMRQGIALYRGEFLAGWSIGDSAAFEEWAMLTREQLRQAACDALQLLTDGPHAAGAAAQVCEDARRWIAIDPLCEEAHRRLMRALVQLGQRTSALAQFAQCRSILYDELGIEPEPATLALYEELKQSAPALPAAPVALGARAMLPTPTRLIGRDADLANLAALLADPASRLITITGPGGVGKTSLALAVVTAHAPPQKHVCFVPLAQVREPALVLGAIAQSLGIQQNDTRPLDALVQAALARQPVLMLLDNCEHLLPSTATLIAALLAGAPALEVLATSRVTLRVSHERRYQLAPLDLPDPDQIQSQSAAVALFIERAQAVRPSLELDYRAIGAICRRLDGLPLAIELAATRTQLLQPHELLARLEQRLPLLSRGLRDLPERHQTLRATIDWSYQLLEPAQQLLFRHLAVFVGGWTVSAAEAICADLLQADLAADDVLDGLAALLDASLLIDMPGAGVARCTMLETIREYAYTQLAEHGELERAQERHTRYMVDLAAQAAAELSGAKQPEWLQRFDAELDNVRAALRWCVEHDRGAGLRLASSLNRFWDIRGHRREGRDWLALLLDHTGQPGPTSDERAAGLLAAGMLSMFLSDFGQAHQRLHESLMLYQHLEDPQNIAWVLNNLGSVELQQGSYTAAERYYRESLEMRRALNHTAGIASSLNNLALSIRLQGNLSAAKTYYDESMALYRQVGDMTAAASVMGHIATIHLQQRNYTQAQHLYEASHVIARELGHKPGLRHTLTGMGYVARKQQRYAEAIGYYRQSLRLSAEIQHIGAIALDFFCFAAIAWAENRVERAVMLLGAAAALNQSAHVVQSPEDSAEFEQHLAWARAAVPEPTFDMLWAHGQSLALEQAIALALED